MSGSLRDQRVVVVGGASGIGLAVGELAQQGGAHVDILDIDGVRLAGVKSKFPNGKHVELDVRDEDGVRFAFEAIPSIDHVYVAAGATATTNILEGPLEAQLALLKLRIWGNAHVVRAATARIRPGGSITFTGGISTARPVAGAWVTNVATAAAEQMARALALDLRPVRFNAVSPGWTDTPMWERVLGEKRREVFDRVAEQLLVGRLSTALEVARAVLFLMENEAVTGETLHVDGGGRLG